MYLSSTTNIWYIVYINCANDSTKRNHTEKRKSDPKCFWNNPDPTSNADGYCSFIYPNKDVTIILFVALFSALASLPIMIITDWITTNILGASTNEIKIKPEDSVKNTITSNN